MLVPEGEEEAGHALPTLVANLCQNYDRQERHHGYYGLEVPCSVFPGRWVAGQQRLRWTLSVQSMLVLEQPSPLDLDLADVEMTASTAAVSPGATEARAVHPGPTSLTG